MSLHCTLCSLTVNSQLQYQQHLEGKAHLKKLKLCAGYASPDSLALAFTKQRPALTAPSCSKQHVRDEKVCEGDSKPLMCDLCQLSLSSQSQAEDHYKGSRHAKKQKAAQLYSNVLITVGQAGDYVDYNKTVTGRDTDENPDPSVLPPPPPPPPPTPTCVMYPLKAPPLPPVALKDSQVLPPQQPTADESNSPVSWSAPAKRRNEAYFCTVCNTEFTSHLQAEAHFRGGKHAKRLKTAQLLNFDLKSVVERRTVVAEVTDQGSTGFYCSFCEVHLNSLLQLDQHRLGGKHKQNLEKCKTLRNLCKTPPTTLPDIYGRLTCEMCCMAFSEESSYHEHMDSPEHQRRENEFSSRLSTDSLSEEMTHKAPLS